MIEGLSHITFIVRDLERMEEILVSVLGARKIYDSGDNTFSVSRERFFLAGEEPAPVWLAIMEGEGRSIYFHDHDNHLFELHTGTLAERLQRYAEGNS